MNGNRENCPMRHENGNCTVSGGFCTAVNDPICETLHNAFDCGYRSAIRARQEVESKLKVVESNAPQLLEYGLIDGILPEGPKLMQQMDKMLLNQLTRLQRVKGPVLVKKRYQKFRRIN